MKHHVKHMALAGALVLALALAFGVNVRSALSFALVAACPVGMVVMMLVMGRRGRGGHTAHDTDRPHDAGEGDLAQVAGRPLDPHMEHGR